MIKKHLFWSILVLVTHLGMAQENTLCALLIDQLKIEAPANIPTVTSNPGGSITLTFPDPNINAIFAAYTIYDFYQSYPNANPEGELIKIYSISHTNKDLMVTLNNTVSPAILKPLFELDLPYSYTPISTALIDLLDTKIYKLTAYCSYSTENGTTCENDTYDVPENFELKIAFNYDAENDIMNAQTTSPSPCGNAFSIGMKGGFEDGTNSLENKLQIWTTSQGSSSPSQQSQACHHIEIMLYSMLDIGCLDFNYGNLKIIEGNEPGQIILERENGTFSTDFMTFEETDLSVETFAFSQLIPFQTTDNPYLQIKNAENQNINLSIFDVSGKQILAERPFEYNSINLSSYANGLYFIKLSNLNQQQNVFKFLKN